MRKNMLRAFTGLILVSVVLSLGFISLYRNETKLLDKVAPTITATGSQALNTFVLNGDSSAEELSRYFLDKGIYSDPQDADAIARWITSRMKKGSRLENLGALNKAHFRMPTDTLFEQPFSEVAGESMRLALATSQENLGITPEILVLYDSLSDAGTLPVSASGLIVPAGNQVQDSLLLSLADSPRSLVSVKVRRTKPAYDTLTVNSPGFKYHSLNSIPYIGRRVAEKILARQKTSPKHQEGVPGVLIRIRDHTDNPDGEVCGFLLTDSEGKASLSLPQERYYSFLPISVGYEYGASKGTRRGPLTEDTEYSFTQRKHTIRPIDARTYMRIKEDVLLSVRTPQEYKNKLLLYPFLFLLAWWLLFIFLTLHDLRKGVETDHVIPLVLMVLSGVGLLAMFSVVHPLTDTLLGSSMATGAAVGVAAMAWLSCVDWGYFYNAGVKTKWGNIKFDFVLQLFRWIKLPFMEKVRGMKLKSGSGILQLAGYYLKLVLAVLFFPLEILIRALDAVLAYLDKLIKKLALSISRNPSERLKLWSRKPFHPEAPKGTGYLIIVLFFILLLQLFGDGPEGSGTKVNLLFFQPSELNKYLVVFFMAAFFAVRADRITTFSQIADSIHLRLQLKSVLGMLIAIGLLLVLYMLVMSDMGPALVLIVTFIFLYSIARKDFPQLLMGIATFLVMVWLGGRINDGSIGTKFIFALLWLGAWIAFWYLKDKRLYESAIFFNFLLSAFIFLGNFLAGSGINTFRSVGQRIVDRNEVAHNLWDNAVNGGGDQVVQGIWSLATGGLFGQGLGKGNPNLVPAFHTDMIFTSIGEEMGWITLLLIILSLAIIIHRSLIIAYKSGDRFLFFLTSGIAIVTGVQFFVIIFGAIGVIPLTGVAVPFLSFGMTSLIINLAIFGITLSVSRINATRNQREINKPYRYVTAVGIESFLAVSMVLAIILFQYQVFPFTRNKYLVRPAFVSNNSGHRLAEYNPRIALLIKELNAGVIYDRNGLPLATSDKEDLAFFNNLDSLKSTMSLSEETAKVLGDAVPKEQMRSHRRYYPFAEQLFFMLGDYNTMTLWGIDDNTPYGYLAEERLMDQLRGFSTTRKDEDGRIRKFSLPGQYMPSVFAHSIDTTFRFVDRDYSFLLPFLKDGIHGRKVSRYNKKTAKGTRDVYLTVDANLQTTLQQRMAQDLSPKSGGINSGTRPKLRASVVVLNAKDGDLLCSANYPLPNQDTIRMQLDTKKSYSAFERQWDRPAYTDQDLGLTYPTAPGSTAKVMSAIAGYMKLGQDMNNVHYHVDGAETIEGKYNEPNSTLSSPNLAKSYPDRNWKQKNSLTIPDNCSHTGFKEYELVSLEEAIVWSSNNFFINLVHNKELYNELGQLYQTVGARVGNDEAKEVFQSYYFDPEEFTVKEQLAFNNCVDFVSHRALNFYNNYMENRHMKQQFTSMNNGALMWAWGQGALDATPLTMARVASIICNDGEMPVTRFIYSKGANKRIEEVHTIPVLSRSEAASLKQYMKEETKKHRSITSTKHPGLPESMGGKTGTPERFYKALGVKSGFNANDGWYICFVDCEVVSEGMRTTQPLAIAVRLERVGLISKYYGESGGSGNAVTFVEKTVLPALRDCNYFTK